MLYVNEIKRTLVGECGMGGQGQWMVLVRFQGCNLKCKWCDSKEASLPTSLESNTAYQKLTPSEVWGKISDVTIDRGTEKILLTGGEPLMQNEKDLRALLDILIDFQVYIETNGEFLAERFKFLDECGCGLIVDFKPPSSGIKYHRDTIRYRLDRLNMLCAEPTTVKVVVHTMGDLWFANAIWEYTQEVNHYHPIYVSATPDFGHKRLYEELCKNNLTHLNQNVQIHKILGCA